MAAAAGQPSDASHSNGDEARSRIVELLKAKEAEGFEVQWSDFHKYFQRLWRAKKGGDEKIFRKAVMELQGDGLLEYVYDQVEKYYVCDIYKMKGDSSDPNPRPPQCDGAGGMRLRLTPSGQGASHDVDYGMDDATHPRSRPTGWGAGGERLRSTPLRQDAPRATEDEYDAEGVYEFDFTQTQNKPIGRGPGRTRWRSQSPAAAHVQGAGQDMPKAPRAAGKTKASDGGAGKKGHGVAATDLGKGKGGGKPAKKGTPNGQGQWPTREPDWEKGRLLQAEWTVPLRREEELLYSDVGIALTSRTTFMECAEGLSPSGPLAMLLPPGMSWFVPRERTRGMDTMLKNAEEVSFMFEYMEDGVWRQRPKMGWLVQLGREKVQHQTEEPVHIATRQVTELTMEIYKNAMPAAMWQEACNNLKAFLVKAVQRTVGK